MKKKNMIIVIIIVLFILFAMAYIFNLGNNKSEINNTQVNNTTTTQINKSTDKNISLNNNSTTNVNLNNNNYDSVKYNNKYKNNQKDSNNSSDGALLAKKIVEKYALDKNEIAGYPVYKDKRTKLWLVPIFDKKTGKFTGSIYVDDGSIFIAGPQSYSEYKEVISGKTSHKSDSNKHVKNDKSKLNSSNNPETIKIDDRIGKANPNMISNNPNLVFDEQEDMILDNNFSPNLNSQMPIIESDSLTNSTL